MQALASAKVAQGVSDDIQVGRPDALAYDIAAEGTTVELLVVGITQLVTVPLAMQAQLCSCAACACAAGVAHRPAAPPPSGQDGAGHQHRQLLCRG